MKKHIDLILLVVAIIASISLTLSFGYDLGFKDAEMRQEIIERHIENGDDNNKIQFLWNDDEESIPAEGSLIKIEGFDENIVLIGPVE
jgi:hypothetical protein